LLPVAALYFARPLAVSPAPFETGSFSPRPTERLGDFFGMVVWVLVVNGRLRGVEPHLPLFRRALYHLSECRMFRGLTPPYSRH
jgi:hypothetical protein